MSDSQTALRQRFTWFLLLRVGITTCLLGAVFLSYQHGSFATPSERMLLGVIVFTKPCLSDLRYSCSPECRILLYWRTLRYFLIHFSLRALSYSQVGSRALSLFSTILPFSMPPFFSFAAVHSLPRLWQLCVTEARLICCITVSCPTRNSVTSVFLLASPTPGLALTVRLAATLVSFYAIAFLGSYLTHRLFQIENALGRTESRVWSPFFSLSGNYPTSRKWTTHHQQQGCY